MTDTRNRLARLPNAPVGARRALGLRSLGLALILLAPLLGGCAAMVLGGAAAGVAAAHDRRHYTAFFDDQDIKMSAMAALSQNREIKERANIGVTSYNRKVLLVGQAESQILAERAAELVSQLPKVERVINEVTVGPNTSLWRQTEDTYLTARAKAALANINMPGFDPLRVKVVTDDGVVYLLGLVTPEEGDAATEKVRFVPGVQRVVKLFEYLEPQA